jgi:hypothetical protein
VGATDFGLGLVRDGALVDGDGYEVLLGNFGSLGNGSGDVSAFSSTDTNAVFAVANDDQRAETEPAAALNYAGHAVDVYDALVKLLFFGCNLWAAAAWAARAAAIACATTSTWAMGLGLGSGFSGSLLGCWLFSHD